MITANQILKKLQEKIWGNNKSEAEAAGNSIKAHGLTYGEFLDEVGKNTPTVSTASKKEKKPLKIKVVQKKPRAKQKITTQRKTG